MLNLIQLHNGTRIHSGWYYTSIFVVNQQTGQTEEYDGPMVPGFTEDEAKAYCLKNDLTYLSVGKECVCVIFPFDLN